MNLNNRKLQGFIDITLRAHFGDKAETTIAAVNEIVSDFVEAEAMIIEILNESELAFQLDGDWLKAGEFKSDKSAIIPPNSETTIEITPSTVRS